MWVRTRIFVLLLPVTYSWFKFVWTIEKFSECQEQNGQYLCSSKFTISGPNDLETHWKLRVFPKGSKKEFKEFLAVYLVNETKANVTVKSCFYILDSSHSIQNRITFDTVHVFEPTADWGFQQFLKLSTQKDESSKKKILLICANSFKKKIEII